MPKARVRFCARTPQEIHMLAANESVDAVVVEMTITRGVGNESVGAFLLRHADSLSTDLAYAMVQTLSRSQARPSIDRVVLCEESALQRALWTALTSHLRTTSDAVCSSSVVTGVVDTIRLRCVVDHPELGHNQEYVVVIQLSPALDTADRATMDAFVDITGTCNQQPFMELVRKAVRVERVSERMSVDLSALYGSKGQTVTQVVSAFKEWQAHWMNAIRERLPRNVVENVDWAAIFTSQAQAESQSNPVLAESVCRSLFVTVQCNEKVLVVEVRWLS